MIRIAAPTTSGRDVDASGIVVVFSEIAPTTTTTRRREVDIWVDENTDVDVCRREAADYDE